MKFAVSDKQLKVHFFSTRHKIPLQKLCKTGLNSTRYNATRNIKERPHQCINYSTTPIPNHNTVNTNQHRTIDTQNKEQIRENKTIDDDDTAEHKENTVHEPKSVLNLYMRENNAR